MTEAFVTEVVGSFAKIICEALTFTELIRHLKPNLTVLEAVTPATALTSN